MIHDDHGSPKPSARSIDAFEHQLAKFQQRFGREPGPEDPIFFDPDSDEPKPLTAEQISAGFDDMIRAVTDAGLDPAFVQAWQDVGYIVGTENRHLFSDAEARAFEAAVLHHQTGSPREVTDELLNSPQPGPLKHTMGDSDEGSLSSLVLALGDGFEKVIAHTLRDPRREPAVQIAFRLGGPDLDDDTGQLIAASTFALLTGWLTGAREYGAPAGPAMQWVAQRLGDQAAEQVLPISGLIGHDLAPQISMEAAADQLGGEMVPALLWLACGVAATAGRNDAKWLRQFDLADLDAGPGVVP